MILNVIATLLLYASVALAQTARQPCYNFTTILRVDNGTYGPEIEEVHYYYDQWPIGIAVTSTGRLFASYTRGNYSYTVGEIVNKTAEAAYPSQDLQVPPSQLGNSTSGVNFATNNASAFISVQALIVTTEAPNRNETLWALDTGRPTLPDGSMPYALPGGPKLVAIDLNNNTIYRTYTFPETVHFVDSYMNDVRIDLTPNITESGQGIAYIVDSSNEGRNGFIMLDLGTGQSWRRLTQHPSTLRVYNAVDTYFGKPTYSTTQGMIQYGHEQEGLDGIQITPDGATLYYSPLTSDYLYSIETSYLRDIYSHNAEQLAAANVKSTGQRGGKGNGFEGDNNGLIYQLIPDQNAVYVFNQTRYQTLRYLRDPRILWPDGASIGQDGYIYLNINQLPLSPSMNNGTDLRTYPGAILRAKLPNNGTKIQNYRG